ncbi:amidohydrolase family protein [Micromonospora cathayae]|uniref:Amidohydrolase family protein n=1 Tax=Micromonospora cathayae TaxID=3028804 RepID=A0ABY7ZJ69_9ACTN|nr:amidohydrolase family protein [Micromonospora sp. HUAS 3]WDZ82950.1 amidohydrolase family protein [Micromonospora sp. HUAS 3]
MERADAHLHLFADGYPGDYGRSPAGSDELVAYESIRRVHHIDRALVVGYEGAPGFAGNNDHLARLAADHDWIAPVAYLPPGGPADPASLDRWRSTRFVGVAAYLADPAAGRAHAEWLGRAAGRLNRTGALLSLNAAPAALAELGPALAALPDCVVLVSHLGLPGRQPTPPDRDTAADLLAPLLGLADLPHLGVKVSGLYAVSDPPYGYPHAAARPFVELLLDTFGPQRLYWGSDFPPSLDHVSFAQTLYPIGLDRLSPADAADVYGGNLRRALRRHADLTR